MTGRPVDRLPRRATEGERPAPAAVERTERRANLMDSVDWDCVRNALGLSVREQQVAQSILGGRTLHEVARQMDLGLGTVKTYSQRVYRKLGIRTQRDLTLAVLEVHLGLTRVLIP